MRNINYSVWSTCTVSRDFIKFLCRRSVGVFSQAVLVFLMKESKKRRWKQPGKLMAKSRSQPINLPSAWPLMNPRVRFKLLVQLLSSDSMRYEKSTWRFLGYWCCCSSEKIDAILSVFIPGNFSCKVKRKANFYGIVQNQEISYCL